MMYYALTAPIGCLCHVIFGCLYGGLADPVIAVLAVGAWVALAALLRTTVRSQFRAATFAAGVVQAVGWTHIHAFTWTFVTLVKDHPLGETCLAGVMAVCFGGVYFGAGLLAILPLAVFGSFVLRLLPNTAQQPTSAPSGARG